MKIEFESTPFSVDEWWAGEIEVNKEEKYPFTLFASNDNGVLEVTWTEKTPSKNIIALETRIKQNYLQL